MKVIFNNIPSIKLSYNQKLILKVLKSDFRGRAFGPQMLDETDDEELKKTYYKSNYLEYASSS